MGWNRSEAVKTNHKGLIYENEPEKMVIAPGGRTHVGGHCRLLKRQRVWILEFCQRHAGRGFI